MFGALLTEFVRTEQIAASPKESFTETEQIARSVKVFLIAGERNLCRTRRQKPSVEQEKPSAEQKKPTTQQKTTPRSRPKPSSQQEKPSNQPKSAPRLGEITPSHQIESWARVELARTDQDFLPSAVRFGVRAALPPLLCQWLRTRSCHKRAAGNAWRLSPILSAHVCRTRDRRRRFEETSRVTSVSVKSGFLIRLIPAQAGDALGLIERDRGAHYFPAPKVSMTLGRVVLPNLQVKTR